MPKRSDIKKILVIGSGPIVIGQAAEFDYAGSEAIGALKEEGYEVVLVNSNPATIQTDVSLADKVYMEPLTIEYLAKIIRYERPDAILPTLGGQTGLNLAMKLDEKGVLKECQVELLGTSLRSIKRAEDRELFKELCIELGEPVLPSKIATGIEEGVEIAEEIGYPLILRPAFTLGGSGGGFCDNEEQLRPMLRNALELSPIHEVLIEKSIRGFKEIEYEVIRDSNDTAITVCNMENIDPVGIHTGDSIVVCPSQTLTNQEYQMLRDSSLRIIRELKIEGGCNVQFALDPYSMQYYLIEVNPRVSRSSALASKASGYPIARVSAKIAIGMTLDEINLKNTIAAFEPALDYVVSKLPRFPFDKFRNASNLLSTQMKATGEVMSIGRSIEESLLKGVRSLEIKTKHLFLQKFVRETTEYLLDYVGKTHDDRIFAIAELMRREVDLGRIADVTKIDMLFLEAVMRIVQMEKDLISNKGSVEWLKKAKYIGFCDAIIAKLWGMKEEDIFRLRKQSSIYPTYKMIDSCASEFDSYIPYFYSTYETENESIVTDKDKIIVLGSGPIRIGQGVEFDYSSVHAVKTIRELGYEAIIINNNPETVSTDYNTSDKLYFEPLNTEDVLNIYNLEKPKGVIVTLGGQTAINLAESLEKNGVNIIGTGLDAIDKAENRDSFEKILEELDLPSPKGCSITTIEDGLAAAEKIGYPVLARPSFVLGGRAMQIIGTEEQLIHYLNHEVVLDKKKPVLIDKYIYGKEVEVDAVCDGKEVFVPAIMELIERTGVHSGDSISIYPPYTLTDKVQQTIIDYTRKLGLGIGILGLFNIQYIVDSNEDVYIIEVNPRSSRSVPFISKSCGYSLADIATKCMLGLSLKDQGIENLDPVSANRYYVKAPAFSFSKLSGLDIYLSPEMKSTGEAIGYDKKPTRALYKALIASGMRVKNYGTVFATIANKDKEEALPLIKRFYDLGFNIEATSGTANYLKEHDIKTRIKKKLSDSDEILESIRRGYVTYVINTRDIDESDIVSDGYAIRKCAVENNVTIFTTLDTVKVLLDVIEDMTIGVSTIN